MTTGKRIKSLAILLGILLSLGANAYTCLDRLSAGTDPSHKRIQISIPLNTGSVCDNVFYEELESEDDGETSDSPHDFYILPHYAQIMSATVGLSSHFTMPFLSCSGQPLFISIRVLRI